MAHEEEGDAAGDAPSGVDEAVARVVASTMMAPSVGGTSAVEAEAAAVVVAAVSPMP